MQPILMAYSKQPNPGDELPQWLRRFGTFLLHVILIGIDAFVISLFLAVGLEKLNLSERVIDFIFLWGPAFPGESILGFLIGFWVNRFLQSKSAKWAWIPFAVFALWGIYSFKPLGAAYGVRYLFGTACVQCADQLLVVNPFVASIAYSLGAWATLKRNSYRPLPSSQRKESKS